LRRNYPDLELYPTGGPGDATCLAAEAVLRRDSLVIAAGGDGTINEVMNGLVNSPVALGVVPFGTANVLACELRLGNDPVAVAERLPELRSRRIAVGRLTTAGASRHFLLMAGAGLDAAIVSRVKPKAKDRFGKLAYWWAGLSTFGEKLPPMEACADGRKFTTGFALAARVRNYGGDLEIASRASLESDQFELVTFEGGSTWPYPLYLSGALVGKAASLPGVHSMLTRRVELAPCNGHSIETHVDGEPAGPLPATLEVVPSSLTLLMPEPSV